MTEIDAFLYALDRWLTVDRAMFLYFIYNAAVQALPDPIPESSRFYLFTFRFAHALAANINVVRKANGKKPPVSVIPGVAPSLPSPPK